MSMTRGAKMLMVRNEANRGNQTNRQYGRMENEMRGEGGSGGRNEMRYEMRNEGEMRRGGSGGRNDYGEMNYPNYEYGGMNYGESRFRDRRGREHYDNGRFAPMNEMRGEMENEMRGEGMRSEGMEMRRGAGGQSHYPFGPVPPVYERDEPMNRIGFVVPVGQGEVNNNFRSDASYYEMGHQRENAMRGGATGEDMTLTEDMAHDWMKNLQNEDGSSGPHWTKEQTTQVMRQKEIECDPLEFWVAMNAMYSDYCAVAKKMNVNNIDFYAHMAKAFIFDKDSQPNRLARYYMYVTKH